jgi:hypothetical protein
MERKKRRGPKWNRRSEGRTIGNEKKDKEGRTKEMKEIKKPKKMRGVNRAIKNSEKTKGEWKKAKETKGEQKGIKEIKWKRKKNKEIEKGTKNEGKWDKKQWRDQVNPNP